MADVFGLELPDLPEGWQPVEAVVIVKCLLPEASGFPYALSTRPTAGLSAWEAEGMGRWAVRQFSGQLDDVEEGDGG